MDLDTQMSHQQSNNYRMKNPTWQTQIGYHKSNRRTIQKKKKEQPKNIFPNPDINPQFFNQKRVSWSTYLVFAGQCLPIPDEDRNGDESDEE